GLRRLGQLHYPVPRPLRASASDYLDHRLREEVARLRAEGSLDFFRRLLERGRSWGYQPEREILARELAEALGEVLQEIGPEADLAGGVRGGGGPVGGGGGGGGGWGWWCG